MSRCYAPLATRRTSSRPVQRFVILLLTVLAWPLLPAQADSVVYKWVDAQNNTHYSDQPPPEGTSSVQMITMGSNKSAARAATPASSAPRSRATTGNEAPQSPVEKKMAADLAAARSGDCDRAKAAYDSYTHSRRLYKAGDNNERIYLSDAEIEQARSEALRDVETACGANR